MAARRNHDLDVYAVGEDGAYYPAARPRAVRSGIKAKSKRGAFGESWWAKRWMAVLEGFHLGARLQRGRSYARRGQVIRIDIAEGMVTANVQGSRPRPYDVVIEFATLGASEWRKVADALAEEALFAAKLLAGAMPPEIVQVFEKARVSLFPSATNDLTSRCSCPDSANPCKHVAAVYYLLGEEFDRDPFLIFRLRGMSREGLVKLLGKAAGRGKSKQVPARKRRKATHARKRTGAARKQAPGEAKPIAEPLPAEPAVFFREPELPADLFGAIRTDGAPAAMLPRRLGSFPFWRGEEGFLAAMERMYRAAAQAGLEVVAGRPPAPKP